MTGALSVAHRTWPTFSHGLRDFKAVESLARIELGAQGGALLPMFLNSTKSLRRVAFLLYAVLPWFLMGGAPGVRRDQALPRVSHW